jgi:hypothetical protein
MKYECSYKSDLNDIESVTYGLADLNGLIDMLRSILVLCSKNATADIIVDHSNLDAGPLTMKDLSILSSHIANAEKPVSFRMINACIWLFRQKGLPIIRIYHTNPQWGPKVDSEAFAFPSSVMVAGKDPKIVKNFPSAFRKTELDRMLKTKGYNTLFLCGLSATGCVLATYHGAAERSYNVFMVKDAIMSPNRNHTKVIEDISDSVNFQTLMFRLDH